MPGAWLRCSSMGYATARARRSDTDGLDVVLRGAAGVGVDQPDRRLRLAADPKSRKGKIQATPDRYNRLSVLYFPFSERSHRH